MKVKLIKSFYDPESGESYAFVKTKYGVFVGSTKVHEEDKDIASSFAGCSFAETKAIISYEKEKLKEYKNRLNILETLVNNMEKLSLYNKNDASARYIRKQYYITRNLVNEQTQKIDAIKKNLYNLMENYRKNKDDFEKKVEERRAKRQTKKETAEE